MRRTQLGHAGRRHADTKARHAIAEFNRKAALISPARDERAGSVLARREHAKFDSKTIELLEVDVRRYKRVRPLDDRLVLAGVAPVERAVDFDFIR